MSKIQSALAKCVEDVAALLAGLSETEKGCDQNALEEAFLDFYNKSWLLPELSEPQNAALATVSCIPLWELLNLFSGVFSPVDGARKAVAVGLLTTLYPKSSDRRCLFQQPGVVGSDYANGVPLFIPVPMSSELLELDGRGTESFRRCASAVRNPVVAQATARADRATAVSLLGLFAHTVVPSTRFVTVAEDHQTGPSGSIFCVVGDGNSNALPLRSFAGIIWNYLVLAENLSCTEGKDLRKVLTASSWSAQTVMVKTRNVSYAELFAPVVDTCTICLATCATPSPTTDNIPLVDSAVLKGMLTSAPPKSEEAEFDFTAPCQSRTLSFPHVALANDVEEQLGEQLLSSIPQEIELFSSSAACRDCDQLTMLCRNLLFSPIRVRTSDEKLVDLRVSAQLNFGRKRPRGDDDGPALLPVTLALSDTLGEGQATATPLERLCVQLSAAGTAE